jgi:hypothetical protein
MKKSSGGMGDVFGLCNAFQKNGPDFERVTSGEIFVAGAIEAQKERA